MDDQDYIDAFRHNEYLSELGAGAFDPLLESSNKRTFVSGEPLWSVGETGSGGYLLVSGCVELTWRTQPDGKQQRRVDEVGSILALAHLAGEWDHESAAYATERTDILELPRETFDRLFEAQAPIAYRMTDAITDRMIEEVRDANRRLQDVFGHPAETLRTLRRRAHDSTRR